LNGCSITCNKTVTIDPVITYDCSISGISETCNGTKETFTAPGNLDSYDWNVTGDGIIAGSNNEGSIDIISTNGGSYTITLQTMLNGVSCFFTKDSVKVTDCTNACTYTQGFYGNPKGSVCYNNFRSQFVDN
jgi:hypothetical protein